MDPWALWLIAGLLLMAFEFSFWGELDFLIVGIAALCLGGITWATALVPSVQLVLFAALSWILLYIYRGHIHHKLSPADSTPEHNYVGKQIEILEISADGKEGTGKLSGSTWRVRNEGDLPLAVSDKLVICRVESTFVVVNKSNQEAQTASTNS